MRSGAQPTLAHVARAAGVSKTTASASLRDLPGPSAQTKAKVREAARQLGYRVSVGAKSLRVGMQPTAAVIFDPAIVDREHFVDTYWAQYMNSMILTASAAKVPVIFVSATDTLALEGHQLDVVLFMTQDAMIDQLEGLGFGLPLLANATSAFTDPRLAGVLMHDHGAATTEAFGQMFDVGCRRPALIFGRERTRLGVNEVVFREWCATKGVEPTVIQLSDGDDPAASIAEIADLMLSGIDSIYTLLMNPSYVVEASRAAGKSIPEDVKLVAQTESTAIGVWDVPLSNVSFLGRESGKIAAQALLAAIDGNVEPVVHMPHLFTARASSGA